MSTRFTLTLLGAGGAFSRRYGTTCSLLTLPNGAKWLLDCGRQAPDQLHAAGLRWHDIDGQIVTHVHGDHVFGIEEFALVRYFESHGSVAAIAQGGPRPKLVAHQAVRDELWEVLGPSLRYLPGDAVQSRPGSLAHYFDVYLPEFVAPPGRYGWPTHEIFVTDGLYITAREVLHVPGKPACTLELRTSSQGASAWWSGDATVDAAALVALEPRVSVFFHDCTFVEPSLQVHGAFSLLAGLPENVRRKMVVMHHEDDLEMHRKAIEDHGFRIAEPGQTYDLTTGQRIA